MNSINPKPSDLIKSYRDNKYIDETENIMYDFINSSSDITILKATKDIAKSNQIRSKNDDPALRAYKFIEDCVSQRIEYLKK